MNILPWIKSKFPSKLINWRCYFDRQKLTSNFFLIFVSVFYSFACIDTFCSIKMVSGKVVRCSNSYHRAQKCCHFYKCCSVLVVVIEFHGRVFITFRPRRDVMEDDANTTVATWNQYVAPTVLVAYQRTRQSRNSSSVILWKQLLFVILLRHRCTAVSDKMFFSPGFVSPLNRKLLFRFQRTFYRNCMQNYTTVYRALFTRKWCETGQRRHVVSVHHHKELSLEM